MIYRCVKSTDPHHNRYYGGVIVCERWLNSYDDFYADMGERLPGTTIDRHPIKDGPYEPDNCRWAKKGPQMNNMTKNVVLDIGMFTGTVSEWMSALGIPYKHDKLIYFRLEQGFTPYEALFTPIIKGANQFTAAPRAVMP